MKTANEISNTLTGMASKKLKKKNHDHQWQNFQLTKVYTLFVIY